MAAFVCGGNVGGVVAAPRRAPTCARAAAGRAVARRRAATTTLNAEPDAAGKGGDGGEKSVAEGNLQASKPRAPVNNDEVLREDEDEILLGLDDLLTEDERRLRKPVDPSRLRTESERRRAIRAQEGLRRRRRRRVRGDQGEEMEWDKMDTQRLVQRPEDAERGEDYWLDMRTRSAAKPRRRKPVNPELQQRLKKETSSPYRNNWIGIAVVLVFVLVLLYNVLPNQAPIIPIPDL